MAEPAGVTAALAALASRLTEAGVPSPRADAEVLVAHVLGLRRGEMLARAHTGAVLTARQVGELERLAARRAAREPLQHLTGRAPFRSIELAVGPGVFVPRPETEQVAQLAIDALLAVASAEPVAVDLGTGSGAIALSLATEVPHARVIGVELHPEALAWARRNLRELGISNARLVEADLADALPELDGTVDVVISNPPYIPAGMVPRDPEVHRFDPATALYGGPDGLDAVRAVSRTAHRLLRSGGTLVVEHGELQAAAIAALLTGEGWRAVSGHRDALGRDRATTALR